MYAEDLIKEAKQTLVSANESFGLRGYEEDDAWEMLDHANGEELNYGDEVRAEVRRRFERMVRRRATGEPLAYIVGWIDFRDFRLEIKPGMFVPRLTSEFLASQAIRRLHGRRSPVHVDLATGIGPIAISTARAVPHARVWGLDISAKALSQARANAAALDGGNATFLKSDLFSKLPRSLQGGVDIVTIHPPYVPRQVVADLPVEVKKFEPRHTLSDGSVDGLGLVRRVVDEGLKWLCPGGWLLIEITPDEFRNIRRLLSAAGYVGIRSTHGELRHTRVILARA